MSTPGQGRWLVLQPIESARRIEVTQALALYSADRARVNGIAETILGRLGELSDSIISMLEAELAN